MHEFQPQGFGEYLLHDRIGAGGMAEIFLATAQGIEGFEKRLVIKRILPTLSDDEQFVRMFIEEAKLCVALRHPNIVQVYDLGEIDAQYFIAMEYVDGRDLLKTLAACGRKKIGFPTDIALYIVMEVLKGLDYAHKLTRPDGDPLGIIHRDVSPSNVLLSFEGEVKIGDFGIAKASTREKTATGILKGKFGYMAPEQVTGTPIDNKADIFAIGIVLYELLTGHRLFAGKNDLAVLERVRDALIDPPPRFYRADLDPELEHIVMTALARDPAQRYQSSTELHDALHDYVYRSRALIGPAHLGRFMQTLFLGDPEEIERRNRISLPLFGRETPSNGVPVPSNGATFGGEATDDERRHDFSSISGLVDDVPPDDGGFDEKTPLHDVEGSPSRTISALSQQVAIIEDADSFSNGVVERFDSATASDLDAADAADEEIEDLTTNGRPPSDSAELVFATASLDGAGTDDTRKKGVERTARTDVSQPVDQAFFDDSGIEVGSEAIIDFLAEPTQKDQDESVEEIARAEVHAIREAQAQNAATDWDLQDDPRHPRHPRDATPTPLTVPGSSDATAPTGIARRASSDRGPSAIDTALHDDEGLDSVRSWSPAEIVERTASSIEPESSHDIDPEDLASEAEPTVRFDSSIFPALREPEDDTASSNVSNLDIPSLAPPPLTDDYPDRESSQFRTAEVEESDLPTAEVDEHVLEQLDLEATADPRSASETDAALDPPALVQRVDSDADHDPLAVTHTDVDDEDADDETITGAPTVVPVEDETELTAELDEQVRLALATDRDFVSLIDTSTVPDDDAMATADHTETEPIAERTRKPSRRRPISGRRPRPVLLPAGDDARDNLARQPSTRQVEPRRASPKRRVTTRASLSVVNPRNDESITSGGELLAPDDTAQDNAVVDEDTISGSFDLKPSAPDPSVSPLTGVLPNRRNSSGITAALDEAQAIDDQIAEIRRSSSIATHEPTALGMLADALEDQAQLPVIDFEADELTQDGTDLREAILRRQSRRRMVTRSVVLYDEDNQPIDPESLHRPFDDEFDASDMSVPAITSAGQLEHPDADDLFGALSVLDDQDDDLGFSDDDVSLETMSRADARPSISVDERQAIPVPPTQPTELPNASGGFDVAAPSTKRGMALGDNDGYEFTFDDDDEEDTASVNDAHVVSIPGASPEVVELGGVDTLEAPNPSSVSISFGSMSAIQAPPEADEDEFTTVNEGDEHQAEIASLRSGPLGIADEATAEGHSDILAGLSGGGGDGLLVSESFEFGIEHQAELRRESLGRRPSPTEPPPPVRPVSMVQAPGGVEPSFAESEPLRERPKPQRPNNNSALRAVVERHRPIREKQRTPNVPGRASGTPSVSPPPISTTPPGRATKTPGPMGTPPARAMGTPGVRTTGTGRPSPASGTADIYPIAQVQVRRASYWTTVMYVMVGIAVVLAVAAAVSSILLKNRNAVPIAPLPPGNEVPVKNAAGAPPADTPPPAAPKKTIADATPPPVAPPPAKTVAPPPARTVAPPPAKTTKVAKTAAPPVAPPPAKTTRAAKRKAVAPPPPAPAPKKTRTVRRSAPKPKRERAIAPKPKKKKKTVRKPSGEATVEINCSEPTTIRISKVGTFKNKTRFEKTVAPGTYRVTFKRDGKTVQQAAVKVIAGRVATVPCP